jgi:hypothetical protein
MAFTRTRIWHGGKAQPGQPPGGNAQPELPPDAPEPGSVPLMPVPASPRRHDAQQRVTPAGPAEFPFDQAPSSDYIPGFAPGATREQAATRFMPIEELFPELSDDATTRAAQASRRPGPRRPLLETPTGLRGTRRSRTRRWPILVLALASLALGATLWSRDVRVELGAGLARAGAAAASVTRSAPRPPPPVSGGDELREPKPDAPGPERAGAGSAKRSATAAKKAAHAPDGRAGSASTPGLERAAIDALIAGDFARAEQLYTRLAHGAAPEAIREALRILASRHEARAP